LLTDHCSTIEHILNYIGENISKICHHENIYLNFTNKISSLYNFNDILHCQEHEQFFQTQIIGMVVKMMINHYCMEINRILHGKKKITDFEKDGWLTHGIYFTQKKKENIWKI
jgi:hypothetical protein